MSSGGLPGGDPWDPTPPALVIHGRLFLPKTVAEAMVQDRDFHSFVRAIAHFKWGLPT